MGVVASNAIQLELGEDCVVESAWLFD
jgi:hypothetical protein